MIKRTLFIALSISITCLAAKAQQITYGAKIAAGFAYQQIHNTDILSTSSVKTFNIEGVAQMPLIDNFWLEAGLGIAGKGSVVFNDALTTTTHLTYVEVPVSILHKFTFKDLGVFYLGAGGYASMGIGGGLEYETPGSSTSDKLKFGKNYDAQKFDTGLNFSTGIEFRNRVTLNLGFELGLNNIASISQQDTGTSVVKNREFTIGLGYLFK